MRSTADRRVQAVLALALAGGCAEGPEFTYSLTASFRSTDCGDLPGQQEELVYGLTVDEETGVASLWASNEPFARGDYDPELSVLVYSSDTMLREADGEWREVVISGNATLLGPDWVGEELVTLTDPASNSACSYQYRVAGRCSWAR